MPIEKNASPEGEKNHQWLLRSPTRKKFPEAEAGSAANGSSFENSLRFTANLS